METILEAIRKELDDEYEFAALIHAATIHGTTTAEFSAGHWYSPVVATMVATEAKIGEDVIATDITLLIVQISKIRVDGDDRQVRDHKITTIRRRMEI